MTPQFLPQNPLNLTTQKCTLGCPLLDRHLAGGIPCNSITELVAESGSGKTQLCLQLCLSAQLPASHGGLAASSLYIHTEFPFPFRRLHQLSDAFRRRHSTIYVGNDCSPCDYVFVESVDTAHQLLDVLSKTNFLIENSRARLPIRLIVIDSIAALFRSEFENTPRELKRRSSLFFRISGELRALAVRFNLAVLVTNQVGDVGFDEGVSGVRVGNLGCLYSSGRRVCPALGLAWANCVNSRLFLSRSEEIGGEQIGLVNGEGDALCRQSRRQLHVVFAPHLPYSSCELVITREGVHGVDR